MLGDSYIEDSDPWFREYDACEDLFRQIMEQLTARNEHSKGQQSYATFSVPIRMLMQQYNRKVHQLRNKVDKALMSKAITFEEAERRTRQIEILESRDVQLQKLYDRPPSNIAASRAASLTSRSLAFADGGTTSWCSNDSDDEPLNLEVSVSDLAAQQSRILKEQDKGLEELSKVIARQKEIGHAISNEVDHQNEIIDDLADHMDRTDESLLNKTRQVQTITFKDRTCGYWVVIILLFICIITVALIP